MHQGFSGKLSIILFKWLPLGMTIVGGVLLVSFHYFFSQATMPVEPGIFSEKVKIPLDFINLEVFQYAFEAENYVLFQNYESLPPKAYPQLTLTFGTAVWLLLSLGVSLVSTFKRTQFILSMVLILFLLTLTGANSLNIGGLSTNIPMILLMLGFILPSVVIHTFFDHWTVGRRSLVIIPIALLTLPLLLFMSDVVRPDILISEHISMLGLAISGLFMIYIGHAVISSVFVFLVKLNKGVGLKISWHITIITLLYLSFFIYMLLKVMGSEWINIPTPPIFVGLLIAGTMGFFETQRKIRQIKQPYLQPFIGQGLYLIGFAVTVLVFWKAGFSVNRPMMDFLDHLFIYTQIAFTMLFYTYLMANFSGVLDTGAPIDKILFQPQFFAYYHMRIGALLAVLILIVFADGIIGVHFNTASTNVTADYYYAINKPREASILYENSWERYRRNEKALNAVAHLAIAQNQPTAALQTLVRGFNNAPSVEDMLLLSSILNKSGKREEALFYLEKGLSYFPENPYLLNNLSLLYSRLNRGEEAFDFLERIEKNVVALSNKIALQAKHLVHYDAYLEEGGDPMAQINQLAFSNKKGDTASFVLATDELRDPHMVINRARWRNQWTNRTANPISEDLALMDTLLAQDLLSEVEEELRETRVIRSFQDDYINETLKYLNGLAFQFNRSAGYYHAMAANVLMGQMDFEKAAVELIQAEEKGFRNFKIHHLTLLFYGGQKDKAFYIADKYDVSFPDWMKFETGGKLAANDTTKFFSEISTLSKRVKKDFLSGLEEVVAPNLKSFLAYQILLRKGHWLDEAEVGNLVAVIENTPKAAQRYTYFGELKAWQLDDKDPKNPSGFPGSLLDDELSLSRNAYWTPLVFEALSQSENDMEKYNILLEASYFNKDPLLWIYLVKYSRIIGMHSYASSTLSEMSAWVDPKTLEELQLQNL